MLAYALYVTFVGGFAAITVVGHALLLMAVYPGIFGTAAAADRDLAAAEAELGHGDPAASARQPPQLAA